MAIAYFTVLALLVIALLYNMLAKSWNRRAEKKLQQEESEKDYRRRIAEL